MSVFLEVVNNLAELDTFPIFPFEESEDWRRSCDVLTQLIAKAYEKHAFVNQVVALMDDVATLFDKVERCNEKNWRSSANRPSKQIFFCKLEK